MSWFFKSKSQKDEDVDKKIETKTENGQPVEVLNKILSSMDIEANVVQSTDDANNIVLNISTDEPGRVIGEKGETLYSLQYLLNKILYSISANNPKVIIDIDQYRSKRKEKLIDMAHTMAENVKKSGKTASFPPLNSYERKIIHESLHDNDDVATESKGEGYYKRIFVSLNK